MDIFIRMSNKGLNAVLRQANGACHNTRAAYRRISAVLRKSADMSARAQAQARRLHKVSQTFVLRNRSI